MRKTIFESESTPRKDGYYMPAEFSKQERIWMLWPWRTDNWNNGAKPAQATYREVARAIAQFEPITIGVRPQDYAAARVFLDGIENLDIVEMTSDDSWIRDCGPTFVINGKGGVRAVHWHFNAWGGLYDGLYFPWDQDELVGVKVADLAGVDRYRPDELVLEGGSIHVDGEGTVITTEMCLLSPGRNPDLTREQIEGYLSEYLGVDKVIWVKDGIDPEETDGHIDDVACYIAPGKVACIWTDDKENPFYQASHDAYETLSNATDAKGRKLEVYKMCMPKKNSYLTQAQCDTIDVVEGTLPRRPEDYAIASYMNFLIVNGGIILPQYGDENDELAIKQAQEMFPDRKVVGVRTEEVAFGGGNIHCITQQQPAGK